MLQVEVSPALISNLSGFFAYPDEIRRVIYTTNAIESLNSCLRKIIKNRRVFPNDEAETKLIYLAVQNIAQKWTMPIQHWKAALNQFAILFEGRFFKKKRLVGATTEAQLWGRV